MHFFIPLESIPTVTAQQKRSTFKCGGSQYYDSPELLAARNLFRAWLAQHRPDEQLEGPIELLMLWLFPTKTKANFEPKTSSPDCDNMAKMFTDCMEELGYFKNDSQVFDLHVIKRWTTDTPGIYVEIERYQDESLAIPD